MASDSDGRASAVQWGNAPQKMTFFRDGKVEGRGDFGLPHKSFQHNGTIRFWTERQWEFKDAWLRRNSRRWLATTATHKPKQLVQLEERSMEMDLYFASTRPRQWGMWLHFLWTWNPYEGLQRRSHNMRWLWLSTCCTCYAGCARCACCTWLNWCACCNRYTCYTLWTRCTYYACCTYRACWILLDFSHLLVLPFTTESHIFFASLHIEVHFISQLVSCKRL